MSFTLKEDFPTQPILRLELVEERGLVKLIGHPQVGPRWVIMHFHNDGTFYRVSGVSRNYGASVDETGRIVERDVQ